MTCSRRMKQSAIRAIWALLLAGAAIVTSAPAQQPVPTAIPVGVVKAERKAITRTMTFVGRIDAVNRVEVRARVTGYLEAVLFKEGDQIKKGAPLYRIEQGTYAAAVEQARLRWCEPEIHLGDLRVQQSSGHAVQLDLNAAPTEPGDHRGLELGVAD